MKKLTVNILLLFALLAVTTSCVTAKRCAQLFPPSVERKDSVSVVVKETLRDTTIIVPADSSWLQMLIECGENGQALMKELLGYKAGSRTAPPRVIIKDNVLTAECECDSIAIHAILKSRETVSSSISIEKEIIQVPVNYLTWWQRTQMNLGRILGIALLIFVAYRVFIKKSIL